MSTIEAEARRRDPRWEEVVGSVKTIEFGGRELLSFKVDVRYQGKVYHGVYNADPRQILRTPHNYKKVMDYIVYRIDADIWRDHGPR